MANALGAVGGGRIGACPKQGSQINEQEVAYIMDKTSISVPTLQRMLSLKKGAAYWLIKQGHFEIIIVGKKMRVMLDSFEKWYASQFHYKKVDGPAPGQNYANTLSASEVGAVLGMEGSRRYEFLKTKPFHIAWVDGHPRIDKESFETWYQGQKGYLKVNTRKED